MAPNQMEVAWDGEGAEAVGVLNKIFLTGRFSNRHIVMRSLLLSLENNNSGKIMIFYERVNTVVIICSFHVIFVKRKMEI